MRGPISFSMTSAFPLDPLRPRLWPSHHNSWLYFTQLSTWTTLEPCAAWLKASPEGPLATAWCMTGHLAKLLNQSGWLECLLPLPTALSQTFWPAMAALSQDPLLAETPCLTALMGPCTTKCTSQLTSPTSPPLFLWTLSPAQLAQTWFRRSTLISPPGAATAVEATTTLACSAGFSRAPLPIRELCGPASKSQPAYQPQWLGWSDLCFFWANQVQTCKGFLQIT